MIYGRGAKLIFDWAWKPQPQLIFNEWMIPH